ncbi:MAG: sodium/glutamate symporter [Flavobacteriaceae bacterium]
MYVLSQLKSFKKRSSTIKFIPLSLIIGVVASICINLVPYKLDFESFSKIAFHIFNMSVISMGLTTTSSKEGQHVTHKTILGGIWMTAIFTAILCLQSITGFGSVTLFNTIGNNSFFEGYGLLSGHGFAQGSGHSTAIGSVWESEYDLNGAISIGLTFSAIGYLIAVVVGVPFTKWLLMKTNHNVIVQTKDELKIKNIKESTRKPLKIPKYISNILTIITIYIISIIIAFILRDVVLRDVLKDFSVAQMISNIILGLIFVIGLAIAILFKTFLTIIKRNSLLNNHIQKRSTSALIDILIISTFLSIEYSIISRVGIPILMIILCNIIITCLAFYLIRLKSKANYLNERVAALLGTTFGSLANGLILLKILDPKIKSPVYYELALMNFYSAFTLGHIMFIIFAIGEWNNLSIIMGIYFITFILSLVIARFVEMKLKK